MADVGHGGKEVDRLVHLHLQHVANVPAAPADGQRLRVEARTLAGFAQHFHIRQKAHGDGANALPFATGAASLAGVETETVGRIAACLGFQRVGKQLADDVPESDVGGRAGTRRLADGRLIDFEHAVNALKTTDSLATGPRDLLSRSQRIATGFGAAL